VGGRLRRDQAALRARTAEMAGLLDGAMNTVRKVSSELRPGLLDDLGLEAAIEWQAQEFARRTGVPCDCRCAEVGAIDARHATALFRILQEALTNIVRHARAARVTVRLRRRRGLAVLEVADNGRGITPEELARPGSLGLLSMRERAFAFGGEVSIRGRKGRGTKVSARLPIGADVAAEISSAARLLAEARQAGPKPGRKQPKRRE
jgi:signal transduction histidine kinase